MTDNSKNPNSASATGDAPDLRVDVQDPLPETDWFWRRTYAFIMSIASLGFIWAGIESLYNLQKGEELFYITRWMIAVLAMVIVFYMLAPSAEQIVKIIQSARLLKSGIGITRKASIETSETKTEVATTAGPVEQDDRGTPPTRGSSARPVAPGERTVRDGSARLPRSRPRSPYVDEE